MSSAPCAVLSGVTRCAGAPRAPKITLLERSQPMLPFPDGALGCERAFDLLQKPILFCGSFPVELLRLNSCLVSQFWARQRGERCASVSEPGFWKGREETAALP